MSIEVNYAGLLSCGHSEPLPLTALGSAALALLQRHGGDAVEVERLTTSWVGTLISGQGEHWSRVNQPAPGVDINTTWQVLRWQRDCADPPRWWNAASYSEAVAKARELANAPRTQQVMVTRVACEQIGVILKNGHVHGAALRRILAPELPGVEAPEAAGGGRELS